MNSANEISDTRLLELEIDYLSWMVAAKLDFMDNALQALPAEVTREEWSAAVAKAEADFEQLIKEKDEYDAQRLKAQQRLLDDVLGPMHDGKRDGCRRPLSEEETRFLGVAPGLTCSDVTVRQQAAVYRWALAWEVSETAKPEVGRPTSSEVSRTHDS